MTSLKKISSVGYSVCIGSDSLLELNRFIRKQKYSRIFILCDENTFRLCLPELMNECEALHEAELLEIESGEEHKNLEIVKDLLAALTDAGADRHSLLLNLGGGVVSDMGGFIASIYKRGFDFVNVPTTLLSMADASVGGKTGVDFKGLKNHIGTFAQPKGVFVFPDFLHSLPKRELLSGLAEVLKAGLICDADFFAAVTRLKNLKPQKSVEILYRSVTIKNNIVKKDPEEKNIRKALNFGHTIGHALETASLSTPQPLLHGEAVALGMLAEARISCDMQYISSVELRKIANGLARFFPGLKAPVTDAGLLIDLMRQDKKNREGNINFVLLNKLGKYRIDCVVPEALVVKSLHELSL